MGVNSDFQRNVITSIKNSDDIVFVTYSAIEDTEEKIIFALGKILERYNLMDIFTPILSCIKELIANATKANAKTILIKEGKIENPDDPVDVVKQIRSILNQKALLEYGMKAKKNKLSVRIYLKMQEHSFTVEVINNVPLTEKEQSKILKKIKQSSKYDNIAEFYMDNPDPEAEGMGLGLSMVVVLLKNIDISHENFVVTSNKVDKTYAKILVPLSG